MQRIDGHARVSMDNDEATNCRTQGRQRGQQTQEELNEISLTVKNKQLNVYNTLRHSS